MIAKIIRNIFVEGNIEQFKKNLERYNPNSRIYIIIFYYPFYSYQISQGKVGTDAAEIVWNDTSAS